jgi:plasmid stabilization system protein ParE
VRIRWSREARDDVDRLVDFVARYDPVRADEIERELQDSPKGLLSFPRRGPRLSEFDPREVREYRVRAYLLRHELTEADIIVLRFFHAKRRSSRLNDSFEFVEVAEQTSGVMRIAFPLGSVRDR